MKHSGYLPSQKALSSFFSILPSSRLCFVCETDNAARQARRLCKGNRGTMMWYARAWGAAFIVLALTVLLPFLHSWAPAEAKIHPSSPSLSTLITSQVSVGDGSLSAFVEQNVERSSVWREAPLVRNGKSCVSHLRSRHGEDAFVCDQTSVHIAMTLDTAYLRGSMAAVFSILQHASCPESIIFHFILVEKNRQFSSLVRSTFPFLKFKVYLFDPNLVRDRISSSVRQALEQPLNYARNYLGDLLEPCVKRVIYLDSDLVVVDDIVKLWNIKLGSHAIGAPEYCHANFTKYFSSAFWMDAELVSTFKGRNPCYFNTGVMIIDLMKWRQQCCTKKIEQWMEIQKARRIYELGSLPPYLLVFAGFVEPVEHRWNQHGLGGDNVKGSCRPLHPGPVSLLHWSGEGKPWTRLDSHQPCPLDSLWAPYDLFLNTSR